MQHLTQQDAERILARNYYGRLACFSPSRDRSYIVPMSYAYHDGSIYLVMVPGEKYEFLVEHPHGVCFEVDEIEDDQTWLSAIAVGDFEEIEGAERTAEEHAALRRILHGPLRSRFHGKDGQPPTAQRLHLGAIRISSVSARQERWSWEVDFPQSLERLPA